MTRPDIPVTISGDDRGFRAAMARVRASAGAAAGDVTASFLRLKSAAGALPAFLAAAGLTTMISAARDAAAAVASIGDEAKRAGLSAKAFQELKFVAEQNRIGVDALTDGIKELNLRADEFITTGSGSASEAFQRLGYDADDLKTKLKDPSALFSEIIGRLGELDRAAQIRVADEIFGGSAGERFVELIGLGERGIKKMITQANEFGLVMSDEMITKAAEVDRQFNLIASTVGTKLKSAVVSAVTSLSTFLDMLNTVDDRSTSTLREQLSTKQETLAKTGRSSIAYELVNGQHGQGIANLKKEIADLEDIIAKREKLTAQATSSGTSALPKTGRIKSPTDILREAMLEASLKGRLGDFSAQHSDQAASSGGGSEKASSANKEAEAIQRVIKALEDEIAVLGLTEIEKERVQALREAGVAATSAEGQQISALIDKKYEQIAAEDALIDARERAAQAAEDFGGVLDDQLDRAINGTFTLKGAVADLAQELLRTATGGKGLFSGIFSLLSGGGGLTSPSFRPTTTLGSLLGYGGARAGGGSVSPGRIYRINENEQEFFAPGTQGSILAPSKMAGDSVNVTYAPQIDARGASVEAVARLEQAMTRQRQDLEANVISIVRKAKNSRVKGL